MFLAAPTMHSGLVISSQFSESICRRSCIHPALGTMSIKWVSCPATEHNIYTPHYTRFPVRGNHADSTQTRHLRPPCGSLVQTHIPDRTYRHCCSQGGYVAAACDPVHLLRDGYHTIIVVSTISRRSCRVWVWLHYNTLLLPFADSVCHT